MSKHPLRVLLTNDDGPPGKESPYIFGLWQHLKNDLGWDVKVVVPSSQKSWIGNAYQISDTISGRYLYPSSGQNGKGEMSEVSRPLRDGELGEWILLDGTPATCTNIAIHNLYHGKIDLVLSGPNLGRNTSAAFSLSSGTIGAAMSGALSSMRSIALSYGTMSTRVLAEYHAPAHALAGRIITHLVQGGWAHDPEGLRSSKEVDLYSINVPMIPQLLEPDGVQVCSTRIWRNSYARLFKAHEEGAPREAPADDERRRPKAGPDAPHAANEGSGPGQTNPDPKEVGQLVFKWAPEMKGLIRPDEDTIPTDTDAWAIHNGFVSVTPLRASFAEAPWEGTEGQQNIWKLKL